jgi:hypothetical protein
MTFPIVEESTVLKKTTDFLINRGVVPYRFSVARGKGIDSSQIATSISQKFASVGLKPGFSTFGADIEGISEKEWWRIECKGTGTGTSQTQRNNFDRALASVVTYFELPPYTTISNIEEVKDAKLFLGLALPASPHYLRELKRRVRRSLRMHLNLWILLYDPVLGSVKDVPPNQDY